MPKARPPTSRAVRGSLLPMIREEPNQAKRRAENGRKPARSGDPPDRIDLIDLGPSKGSNRSYRCGSLERIDPASSTGPVPASRQSLPLRRTRIRARARARASCVAAPVPLARGFHRPGPAQAETAQPKPAQPKPAQPDRPSRDRPSRSHHDAWRPRISWAEGGTAYRNRRSEGAGPAVPLLRTRPAGTVWNRAG